ncbi:hypothetical protein [Sphingomonas sp. ERG5]|uniref:hypothetical protein n=1 Tax=Sphingomonas sp. ERG5 TaxID=1381597 RepID=UPI001F2C4D4E|nr:hypothetical protein [Sphingomonas sp. ERG5]
MIALVRLPRASRSEISNWMSAWRPKVAMPVPAGKVGTSNVAVCARAGAAVMQQISAVDFIRCRPTPPKMPLIILSPQLSFCRGIVALPTVMFDRD